VHIDEFDPEVVSGVPMGKPKTTSIYSRQIGNRFLLLSNDLQEMEIVSDRLVASSQGRPSQDEIREWSELTQNQLWGYRLYEHNADLDKMAAGTQKVGPGTRAIACVLRPDRKALTISVFTSSMNGEETIKRLNSEKRFPPLVPIGGGAWESVISTSDGLLKDHRYCPAVAVDRRLRQIVPRIQVGFDGLRRDVVEGNLAKYRQELADCRAVARV